MMGREDYSDVDTVDGEDRGPFPVRPRVPEYPLPPAPVAFHGPLGEMVRMIEPHTEADPAALLAQALVAFGSVIGRNTYFVADGAKHYGNLFAVVVAASSKGRKGTAWSHVRGCLEGLDADWRTTPGLASGEGLIWQVRDATADGQTDSGISDKRLLVVEPEFAKVLRVVERDGSTLSAVLREAWDSGNLSTLTKNSPAVATGAHISVIGHITAEELRRYLTATEAGNGFGNRFLWVCARRSKYLPDGGALNARDLAGVQDRLRSAVQRARGAGELRRDDAASARWHAVYRDLSEGRPGLLGSMTGRAEAQVMRLGALYALSDGERAIGRTHLDAALALWRYCHDSAAYIFGDALGDPVADDLLIALREAGHAGMSRTEISRDVFGRNRTKAAIGRALALLHDLNLARGELHPGSAGRPEERWFAVRTN